MKNHGAYDTFWQLSFETQAARTSHLHSPLFQQLSSNLREKPFQLMDNYDWIN